MFSWVAAPTDGSGISRRPHWWTRRSRTVAPKVTSSTLQLKRVGHVIIMQGMQVSNKFLFNNQPDASIIQIYSGIELYMFRASSLPIIGCFLLYIRHFLIFILTLLGSGHQTCVKLTSAECTVENSWWWAEKMPETCRVL